MLNAERITDAERELAAAASGALGPSRVLVRSAEVPIDDALTLSALLFQPEGADAFPAVLIRTPYGKGFWRNDGIFWASHGYGVVLQDCRGTASYFDEASDGAATVQWIQSQDWYDGHLGLHGMSYMGFTAWATASECRADVDAISVSYFSSDRTSSWYPGGSFGLDMALAWSAMQDSDNSQSETDQDAVLGPPLASVKAYLHLPLIDADQIQTGEQIPFFRERLTYWADDPHWEPLDFSGVLSKGCPPTLLFGGWYDYQRRYLWEDFGRLDRADTPHRLVMGPWMHGGGWAEGNAEARAWFDIHVRKRDGSTTPTAISFYVTGENRWKDASADSVLNAPSQTWYFTSNSGLATTPDEDTSPTSYSYDPADPTPSVGLASFDPDKALPCDNRALEERPDVVTFTGSAFEEPMNLFGPTSATLWVKSSAKSTDFFVRLTDVHSDGASYNVIDALQRIEHVDALYTGEDPLKLEIDLGPCAHRFESGHRLRVQISSGAFPFYVSPARHSVVRQH